VMSSGMAHFALKCNDTNNACLPKLMHVFIHVYRA
jgi:hypothetical protein